ncbi:hypothetical protein DOY81_004759 [Sarcophaga bullata]|nr:hypothetical protein DOY81_004759 [Sarcophaga bullata]
MNPQAFDQLNLKIITSPKRVKLNIFDTTVKSALLYDFKTWYI